MYARYSFRLTARRESPAIRGVEQSMRAAQNRDRSMGIARGVMRECGEV
jgi:hypothetical protein